MKLIDNARLIWKRWSVWIVAAQGSIALLWLGLPDAWQPTLPEWVKWGLVAILSAAALTVTPIKQASLTKDGQ